MLKILLASALLALASPAWADPPAHDIPTAPPALSRWVRSTIAENPRLLAERAALEAARGRVEAASRPLFNPELGLDYERTDVDTASVGISQTLDWANKRDARATQATRERQVAVARLQQRWRKLAAELLGGWSRWHAAKAIAEIADRQADLMQRFVALAERRRQAGDLAQVDLDLAHLAASEAEFRRAGATGEKLRARRAIEALTAGRGGPPGLDPATLPPELPELDVDKLVADLPAIREAMASAAAARAGVELRRRERRADPTVGLRLGKEDSNALGGLSFSIPLNVRNRYRAEVAVAEAEALRARREVAGLRREARARLVAAAAIYGNARATWVAWRQSGAPRLDQRTALLDRLWQAGELRTTDYLVQLKQALETETAAIEQLGRLWQAWTDYLLASGQIEAWLGGAQNDQ